jgi:multisubunit Na+/H+ antiporter MnhF subunit
MRDFFQIAKWPLFFVGLLLFLPKILQLLFNTHTVTGTFLDIAIIIVVIGFLGMQLKKYIVKITKETDNEV